MDETSSTSTKGITGNMLKIIAVFSMLLDHIGVAIIENGILKYQDGHPVNGMMGIPGENLWSMADFLLRTIGRIAFPIFCFLLVEGFFHTRDVKKYGARLFLFALISEIPFDLAIFGKWFYPDHQNVYVTLCIGLWVLYWYEKAFGNPIKQTLVILAGSGAAVLLKCDYSVEGIAMILLFYVFYKNKTMQTVFAGILAAIESLECYGAAALAFIPIRMYNGTRGKRNLKYLFYWFYPTHLFLLYILRLILVK